MSDEALHVGTKTLAGRHNALTAELLAHLAEVEARGIHRERACSSLYTYCVYELRFSEDEAQRRARAARAAREYPMLFEMLADGAIHMTGLLLLAPHLTADNQAELLARARFRTKREIERLVAEVAPRPDVPARIEPLGPLATRTAPATNLWQAYTASLAGLVRDLQPGTARGCAPPATFEHRIPSRDIAEVHELAMAAFVEQLRRRRQAMLKRPKTRVAPESRKPAVRTEPSAIEESAPERIAEPMSSELHAPERTPDWVSSERSAPERMPGRAEASRCERKRHVPAAVRRAVWSRDAGRCTFMDSGGQRCHERAGLELHHEHAFALGGRTTAQNLRLVCRAHNALLAERDFGTTHRERWRKSRRLE